MFRFLFAILLFCLPVQAQAVAITNADRTYTWVGDTVKLHVYGVPYTTYTIILQDSGECVYEELEITVGHDGWWEGDYVLLPSIWECAGFSFLEAFGENEPERGDDMPMLPGDN